MALLTTNCFVMTGCGPDDTEPDADMTTPAEDMDPSGDDMDPGGDDMTDPDMDDAEDMDPPEEDMTPPEDMDPPEGDMTAPDMDDTDMADPDMDETDMPPDMPVDMGPDCTLDSDFDGLNDCDEAMLCTSATDLDTDDDLLTDYEEFQLGTDPCDPDTDGDGLNDERENYFGFDPNNPSTYGEMVLDGDLFIVTACDVPESEPIEFKKSAPGDWLVALPQSFANYNELTITSNNPKEAAAVYDDPANEVAGFILSTDTNGSDALQTLLGYRSGINSAGSIFQDLTEGEFDTHDRYKAAPGEYRVAAGSKSARKLRDDVLFAIAPFARADVTGLPVSSGNQYNKYYVRVSVIERLDRMITTVSVAPEQFYNSRDAVKFRINDLTNTTNVAQSGDGWSLRCYPFPANTEVPAADFYWVLDQSGSMSDDFAKVKSFAGDFYDQLLNTALDFRLGVANMEEGFSGKLRPTIGWISGPGADVAFSNEIQYYVIDCTDNFGFTDCSGGTEHGLYSAREGIKYMRSAAAPPSEKIRANAQLATIFMSDEEDQSVKDEDDPDGTTYPNEQAVINDYAAFFANNPLVFSIVSNGGSCGEDAEGYRESALASGGAIADLCAQDLKSTITQIIDIVAGRASTFRLPQTPISSTLRVYQADETGTNGVWVPRSRSDGFDYFPQSNSVAFFGAYRPKSSTLAMCSMDADCTESGEVCRGGQCELAISIQVAVHYQTFRDKTKTPVGP